MAAAVAGVLLLGLALTGAALASVPENDAFANAAVINGLPFSETVAISGSTTEQNEPFFCTFMPQTVWYRYQPETSGYVKTGLTSDVPDAFVEAFSGTSLDTLGANGCFSSAQSSQFFFLQAGQTYYFQVGTQSVESGTLTFTLQAPRRPTNDDIEHALQLSSALPLHDFVDMSAATVAASDPTDCFSGVPNIWYGFTPATDTKLAIGSALGQPAFGVYVGTPGALQLVSCGSLPYILDAKGGSTYYIEIADAFDPNVEIDFGEAFSFKSVSVDQRAAVDGSSGNVTVSGSISCNAEGDALVNVDVKQRLNSKRVAEGVLTLFPTCTPAGTSWTGTVVPSTGTSVGPFRPGKATVTVTASACGTPTGSVFTCDSKSVTGDILLVPGP
jgi:hypothetical protein